MSPLERKLYACQLRRRVRNRPASVQLKDLANDAEISRSWLIAFCNAAYRNPHLRLLKRLDSTLTRMCESVQ